MTLSRTGFWLLLASVVTLGILLRLLHLAPAMGSDDPRWILTARHFAGGEAPDLAPVYFTRAVFLALVALWGQVSAISVPAVMPLMFAISALATILVGTTARVIFGPSVGIVAAGLYALHPLNVANDPYVAPDNLAVGLEAAFLLVAVMYLKDRRTMHAILAGTLAGLMFGTKSYFVLVGAPLGIIVVSEFAVPRGSRLRSAAWLLVGLAGGLAVSFVLQAVSSGDPFAEFSANSGYSNELLSRGNVYAAKSGLAAMVYVLIDRFSYVVDLFLDGAGPLGWMCIGGLAWGLQRARHELPERLLLAVTLTLLLFLMFMPVSLSPVILVEMQSRYLTVVLAPLLILTAAGTVQLYLSIREPSIRVALAAVAVLAVAWCAWIPSSWWDRYGVMQVMGIREAGVQCLASGRTALVLPEEWRGRYPEEISAASLALSYADLRDSAGAQRAVDGLGRDRGTCLFVVRSSQRSLRAAIADGHDLAKIDGPGAALAAEVLPDTIETKEILVPEDSFRVWLNRMGIRTRGQLVGWMFYSHEH